MNLLKFSHSVCQKFSRHLFSEICGKPFASFLHTSNLTQHNRIYEPDYLDKLKPETPVYLFLNIHMTGYDFAVLERFQSLVHTLVETLDVTVADGWGLPAESWKVDLFQPNTAKAESEFHLKEYQRFIQMSNVPPTMLSILIEMLQECTPPGVNCSILEHTEEMEKVRFVPDLRLRELQQELDEIGGPTTLSFRRQKKKK